DQMCIGGSTTTAGNLVFLGEANGNFNAYNAQTGQRLWSFQTGAGANAPPVTYQVGGHQYVAVAAGGNRQLDLTSGDTLRMLSAVSRRIVRPPAPPPAPGAPPPPPAPPAPAPAPPAAPAPSPAPAPVQVPAGSLPLAEAIDDAPVLHAAVASSLDPVTNRAAI